jgi:PadR family transcriptional regulator, regulatory protein PadR
MTFSLNSDSGDHHQNKKKGAAQGPSPVADGRAGTSKRKGGQAFDLPEGTIYPALHRLEQAGLLTSRWVTADSGRRRRVYALTRRGIRALDQQRTTWEQFSEAIGGLLGGTRPSKNPA